MLDLSVRNVVKFKAPTIGIKSGTKAVVLGKSVFFKEYLLKVDGLRQHLNISFEEAGTFLELISKKPEPPIKLDSELQEFLESLNAEVCKPRKYKPGEVVENIDPKYKKIPKETYLATIKWPGGGGYVLRNAKGQLHSTTNIRKPGEKRGWDVYQERRNLQSVTD